MQDLENIKKYNTYTLDENILIMYDPNIKCETYECSQYHGIIFYIPNDGGNSVFGTEGRYDIVHNYDLGNRLLINNSEGIKDIPFKAGTFAFLPTGVEAIEI